MRGNYMYRKFAITMVASFIAAPLLATPASATVHVDPCPGQHIQVWSEVGNSGKGQATNHFVCGPLAGPAGPQGPKGDPGKDGADGKDGKDGADSTVPGPVGPQGPAGADGADSTVPGPAGPAGADGVDGAPGSNGADGVDGLNGKDGAPGVAGPQGPAGADGSDGKNGVTKTVIVENGEESEVGGLPSTGADGDDTVAIVLGGLGLIALGGAAYYLFRRN